MPTSEFIRKQDVENKAVLDTMGKAIGTGQDLAFSLDGKLALVVRTPKGEDIEIPMTRIVAVADYIVLNPEQKSPKTAQLTQPVLSPQATVTHVQETCANCGMPLKPGAKFCTHCGTREPSIVPPPATQQQQTNQKAQTCSNCGIPLKVGAKFCTGCGIRLASQTVSK